MTIFYSRFRIFSYVDMIFCLWYYDIVNKFEDTNVAEKHEVYRQLTIEADDCIIMNKVKKSLDILR